MPLVHSELRRLDGRTPERDNHALQSRFGERLTTILRDSACSCTVSVENAQIAVRPPH
jgi:hypothetical protein